ncbi:hypothetical protein FNV43_RR14657 [Rhamnella rubrinervis]|uniref:Uncharacterized protein n=1 Tax=Rhamnella rubrinervis TaxID=2594499 RepID=A0A8K0MFZ1_9ROSA|nr:hypothetical protein FNV43_RR14657 [Rhamnella rubrinervis]
MIAFEQNIKSLHKKALDVKERLLEIKNQLTCCEAKKKKLKSLECEISKNMLKSQKKINDAYKEVEAAQKLLIILDAYVYVNTYAATFEYVNAYAAAFDEGLFKLYI